jgi:hypothetical protein
VSSSILESVNSLLAPCPFCKNENVFMQTAMQGEDYGYRALCPSCYSSSGTYGSKEDTITAWNMRGGILNGKQIKIKREE